jgi:malate dehydrogenase (oxaloacetate-decarboxylating)
VLNKIQTTLRGKTLLNNPLLNKGTAFSTKERSAFDLEGLLPTHIESIDEQLARCHDAMSRKDTPLGKHIYLRGLQDRNETLFYRFILEHIEEVMPLIYTPVVGEACQQFSHIYRHPRGIFISYPMRENIDTILANIAKNEQISVIVVTDGERILGLGDQGIGGLGIPIGKLSLYTACGGICPESTLPIVLDVGTNNEEKIGDPEYFGWRNKRITGKDYDDFVDVFVQAVKRHLPHVLLQFEDFAQQHAYPLLQRYRDSLCTFNDDIQGTAAVAASALIAATKVAGVKLSEQKIAVLGAGSAGCGISEQLIQAMMLEGVSEGQARAQFYMVDRYGLIHDKMENLLPFQRPLAQSKASLSGWNVPNSDNICLRDVIYNAKPSILLGVSGQPNQFSKEMVEFMASYCQRPIIFPMSNPTSRCEAKPEDLIKWTQGKALVATGSPFDDVSYNGNSYPIAQSNNSYIFPGMGLGVVAVGARRITDTMFMSATLALSDLAPAVMSGQGRLLPELKTIRKVSKHIAFAVAKKAIEEGHAAPMSDDQINNKIDEVMWFPEYKQLLSG